MGVKTLIGKKEVAVDPLLYFERALIITNNSDLTKKEVLGFELSTSPPSIFDSEGRLRIPEDKSKLMNYIVKTFQQESSVEDVGLVQLDKTVT